MEEKRDGVELPQRKWSISPNLENNRELSGFSATDFIPIVVEVLQISSLFYYCWNRELYFDVKEISFSFPDVLYELLKEKDCIDEQNGLWACLVHCLLMDEVYGHWWLRWWKGGLGDELIRVFCGDYWLLWIGGDWDWSRCEFRIVSEFIVESYSVRWFLNTMRERMEILSCCSFILELFSHIHTIYLSFILNYVMLTKIKSLLSRESIIITAISTLWILIILLGT